jgi:hypothetical protein
MWKEAAVECLNVQCWHLLALTETRRYIIPSYDNWIIDKKSNPRPLQTGKK